MTPRTAHPTQARSALAAAALALSLGGAVSAGGTVLLATAAVLVLVLVLLVPTRLLPCLSACLFALLPIGYMNVPNALGRYLTPPVLVLLLWQLRVAGQGGRHDRRTGWQVLSLLVAASLLVGSATSVDPVRSVLWTAAIVICFPLVSATAQHADPRTWVATERALLLLAIVAAAVAVAEWAGLGNPWDTLYSSDVIERSWTVFRARSTLGHPLSLSLFLSTCLVLAAFSRTSPPKLRVGVVAAAAAGLSLTASRTGVLAVAAGLGAGLLIGGPGGRRRRDAAIVLVGAPLLLALANAPLLTARSATSGGSGSAEYRGTIVGRAVSLLPEAGFTGFGPGTSGFVFAHRFGGGLENSALQFVLSLGLLGIPLAGLLLLVVVRGVEGRRRAPLAALTALCVSLSGYSALDLNPGLLVLAGLLLLGILTPEPEPPAEGGRLHAAALPARSARATTPTGRSTPTWSEG